MTEQEKHNTNQQDHSFQAMGDPIDGNFAVGVGIQDSLREIQQAATYENLRFKLELLCRQVEDLLTKLPEGKQKEVAQNLFGLVKEALKETPTLQSYEISMKRFINTIKSHAEISVPTIATLQEVLAFLRTDHGKR